MSYKKCLVFIAALVAGPQVVVAENESGSLFFTLPVEWGPEESFKPVVDEFLGFYYKHSFTIQDVVKDQALVNAGTDTLVCEDLTNDGAYWLRCEINYLARNGERLDGRAEYVGCIGDQPKADFVPMKFNELMGQLVASIRSTLPGARGRSGKEVYENACFACHDTGAAGAPKRGAVNEWQTRLKKGLDTLVENAKNGFNAMPPRGICSDCTDEELAAAVNYILDGVKPE